MGELSLEDDKAGMGIVFAHIGDGFDLLRGMLGRMVMEFSGFIAEGVNRVIDMVFRR